MKIWVFIFCLGVPFHFINQETMGLENEFLVEYGEIIYTSTRNTSEENLHLKDAMFTELERKSRGISFRLIYKGHESFFELESGLESDYAPYVVSYAQTIIGKGKYYTNLKEEKIINDLEAFGERFLIEYDLDKQDDWFLSDETKKIGGFVCYKATKKKTIVNSLKSTDFIITAWFTPEIASSFGPKNHSGLPGLILELVDTHFTFTASNISFKNNKKNVIKKPKGNLISIEDFEKKMKGVKKE